MRKIFPVALLLLALAIPVIAKDKPDPLTGPPFVTAKAWAIMDAKTGELLFGKEADKPRKAASTTKMMCAFVVLKLAESDAKVLDEIVTISKFADDTSGSTADVREGEKVKVSELLYGLLLPSGNDAGNALAEHFNDRFKPLSADDDIDLELDTTPRSNFIAEMNRAAKRLGLTETIYRIPYGDGGTPEQFTTSPRDLLRLARVLMQMDRFRQYCNTEKYTGKVTTPDGSTRNAEWTNTNELLKIEGYDGVKTGTTNQAGSCLVSSLHRGDDHLLCVVLGSTSNDGRYTDTQNLLRYALLQRGHKPANVNH